MNRLRKLLYYADIRRLATYVLALWKLFRHPDTPRPARWLSGLVLAYALSPIDLIPDFIPVLGQLDDLLLIPLAIALVTRLVPPAHWQNCLAEAARTGGKAPRWLWGAGVVMLSWAGLLALCVTSLGTLVAHSV
jgi:uncharacterized membrane protein YkvA (DUF1232 family)